MRLGRARISNADEPERYLTRLRDEGYGAALFPAQYEAENDYKKQFVAAAEKLDIVIAEVGAWSNPLSADEKTRSEAIEINKARLALADEIGARCCVNIAGSRGEKWDGPHALNYAPETFELIVDTVRDIIDSVAPIRTFYTLETMPWAPPDSADSYIELIHAIDRARFAVHFDPVNIVTSPAIYFNTTAFLKDCFEKLGPYIQSCHAKDILLGNELTVHLQETRPGLGNLDYRTFLTELGKLDEDMPLIIEHLKTDEDFALAAQHIRHIAAQEGLEFK